MALRAARFDLLELFSNLIRTLHHNAPEPESESVTQSWGEQSHTLLSNDKQSMKRMTHILNGGILQFPFFGKVVLVNMCDLVDVATAWTGEISGKGNFKITKLLFSSTEIVHSDNR